MNQIESALVIKLRSGIAWEASDEISTTGTLTPVDPNRTFDASLYLQRDRELSFRDLNVGAAIANVAVTVSNVWNFKAAAPTPQGAVSPVLVNSSLEQSFSGTAGDVRHVKNSSIPYDAARYADRDLYGRDAIVYETLAKACAMFAEPPIARIDSAGTIPTVTAWSLASGTNNRNDINYALALNRDLFKLPDSNLADRDNQNAAYVSRLVQSLRNPFESANRLYVSVDGTNPREAETYTLSRAYYVAGTYAAGAEVYYGESWYRALVATTNTPNTGDWTPIDGPTLRTFTAEPALSNRNRIVYDTTGKTLQWFREQSSLIHVPQIVGFSIPGVDVGQTVRTVPQIPEPKDAQYWRTKASLIVPSGEQLTDETSLDFTASSAVTGGYTQIKAASLTVPGTMQITLPGSIQTGNHIVSLLTNPSPKVEIAGAQNVQGTSGTLGGATYEVNPASIAQGTQYLVVGGTGVTYNSVTYAPGSTFTGINGVTTYTRLGGSTLQQYACTWKLALPPGAWRAKIDYTDLSGGSSGFGVLALCQTTSGNTLIVKSDTTALPFNSSVGSVVSSAECGFDVSDTSEFVFPVYWTYGTGQFHIRQLTFTSSSNSTGHYVLNGTLGNSTSSADVVGTAYHPDVLSFYLSPTAPVSPALFSVSWSAEAQLPLQVRAVQVQAVGSYAPTPNSSQWRGWRSEMTERAFNCVQQSFAASVTTYGTNTPAFSTGSEWTNASTEDYMAFIEVSQPRVREIANVASGDLAYGRQYEVLTGPVTYGGTAYNVGQKFYCTAAAGLTFTGGTVKQVGAFQIGRPGHAGKAAIVPNGVYFDDESQTIKTTCSGTQCTPHLAVLQPWMLYAGIYVVQPEFWLPENL